MTVGLSEQLDELWRMHASGSLTDAEFADAKRQLLAGVQSEATSASAPPLPPLSPGALVRPRWPLVDLVVVVVLTFAVHRAVHGVLSAPLSLWLYYPTLWAVTAGYLMLRRRPLPSQLSPRLLTARSATGAVAAAVGMLIALWAVGSGLLYLAHRAGEARFPDMPWWVPMRPGVGVVVPVVILAVTIGPFVEEYVFRGVVYAGLLERVRPGWAAVLSSAAFAATHGLTKLTFPFLVGLLLAAVYRRTGSLLAAVLAHITINGVILAAVELLNRSGLSVTPL